MLSKPPLSTYSMSTVLLCSTTPRSPLSLTAWCRSRLSHADGGRLIRGSMTSVPRRSGKSVGWNVPPGRTIRPSMGLSLRNGMLLVAVTGLYCVESVRSFGGPRSMARVQRHASCGGLSTHWWAAGPLLNLRPWVRRTFISSSTPRWLECERPPPMPRRRRSQRSTPDAVSLILSC